MHANSSAFKGPIRGTLYRKVVGDPGKQGVTLKCGRMPPAIPPSRARRPSCTRP